MAGDTAAFGIYHEGGAFMKSIAEAIDIASKVMQSMGKMSLRDQLLCVAAYVQFAEKLQPLYDKYAKTSDDQLDELLEAILKEHTEA